MRDTLVGREAVLELAFGILNSAGRVLLEGPAGLLVAIDDIPWLDPPSERALRFALRRSSAQVRVVATRRA